AEDGIRDFHVTGVQTCALPISHGHGDQHRQEYAQQAVGAQGASIIQPQRDQRQLGQTGGQHGQRPVEHQGDGGQPEEVEGQAVVELLAQQPQHEQHEHTAEQQVLRSTVGHQLDTGYASQRSEQQACTQQQAADDLEGGDQND